jgi:hypothetical protein
MPITKKELLLSPNEFQKAGLNIVLPFDVSILSGPSLASPSRSLSPVKG